MMPASESLRRRIDIICVAVVLLIGIFLRLPQDAFSGSGNPLHALEFLHPAPKWNDFHIPGADEYLYVGYVADLADHGLTSYPAIVERYIELQTKDKDAILPPARFLYICFGYLWHEIFRTDPLSSLRQVASCFSVLTLILSAIFAWRLAGRVAGISVMAMMACAPTQIHMSQHALIDGFFAFWALLVLWALWESLRAPNNWRWIALYSLTLALLVVTKENAFFVWIAIVAIIISNRWLHFGTVTRELIIATVLGPFLGMVALVLLAGGVDNLFSTYQLLVSRASQYSYSMLTGDGPWYRYVVDLLLVSPIVTLLAIGTIFRLNRTMKTELFMFLFVAASYLIMCNIKYGMNLRYANMWDMPLRFLAFSQIALLVQRVPRYPALLTGLAIALISALELRQYYILAVHYPLYELVSYHLLRALHILKFPTQ